MYMQKRHITLETFEKYFSPDNSPIALAMFYLVGIHDLTGLPYYATIGMYTGSFTAHFLPAPVAQLDARPTGDQEVAGSTTAEVGNILSWSLIMKYFLRSFSPFR